MARSEEKVENKEKAAVPTGHLHGELGALEGVGRDLDRAYIGAKIGALVGALVGA